MQFVMCLKLPQLQSQGYVVQFILSKQKHLIQSPLVIRILTNPFKASVQLIGYYGKVCKFDILKLKNIYKAFIGHVCGPMLRIAISSVIYRLGSLTKEVVSLVNYDIFS